MLGCLNTCISATVSIALKETFLPDFPAEKHVNPESNLYSCSFKVAVFAYVVVNFLLQLIFVFLLFFIILF